MHPLRTVTQHRSATVEYLSAKPEALELELEMITPHEVHGASAAPLVGDRSTKAKK
jgi:hypothetical protein